MIDANGNVTIPEISVVIDSVFADDTIDNAGCNVQVLSGDIVDISSRSKYDVISLTHHYVYVPYILKVTVPDKSYAPFSANLSYRYRSRRKITEEWIESPHDELLFFSDDNVSNDKLTYQIGGKICVEDDNTIDIPPDYVANSKCKMPFEGLEYTRSINDYNYAADSETIIDKITVTIKRITRDIELFVNGYYYTPIDKLEQVMEIGSVSIDGQYYIDIASSKQHKGKDTYYLLKAIVPVETQFSIIATPMLSSTYFKGWSQGPNAGKNDDAIIDKSNVHQTIVSAKWNYSREYAFCAHFSNENIVRDGNYIVYDPKTDKIVRRQ